MWSDLAATPLFGVALTLVVYLLAQHLYRRVGSVLANPVLVSIVTIILLLKGSGVEYRDYARGGDIILFLLGPSVVALAVPLYQRREEIGQRKRPILIGIFAGSLASIFSACGLAWILGGSREIILSLAPKSVTTPIAISIVEKIGLLNADLNFCLDYEYWIRAVKTGLKFAFLDMNLAQAKYYADNLRRC